MSLFALSLILLSAFTHAAWNFLSKKAGGGAAFVWWIAALSSIMYIPVMLVIFLTQQPVIGATQLFFMLGNATLHSLYFIVLQRGYAQGDLSIMYPLARGTGPALSTVAAIIFLGERPSVLAAIGGLCIIGGIFWLTGGMKVFRNPGAVVGYGLLTGVIIAAYTLWDKQAVSVAMIPPLLLDSCSSIARTALLSPYVLTHRDEARQVWRNHRGKAIGVAFLSPLAYVLVLTVLTFTPVSYVAPLREVSILIGVLLGNRLLSESEGKRRIIASIIIMAGMVAIALG